MFGRKPSVVIIKLDEVMDRLLNDMSDVGPDAPEYPKMMKQLQKVVKMRQQETRKIDVNTIILVLGNLLGILVIVAYEQKHVFTSKGLGHILRPKT